MELNSCDQMDIGCREGQDPNVVTWNFALDKKGCFVFGSHMR